MFRRWSICLLNKFCLQSTTFKNQVFNSGRDWSAVDIWHISIYFSIVSISFAGWWDFAIGPPSFHLTLKIYFISAWKLHHVYAQCLLFHCLRFNYHKSDSLSRMLGAFTIFKKTSWLYITSRSRFHLIFYDPKTDNQE